MKIKSILSYLTLAVFSLMLFQCSPGTPGDQNEDAIEMSDEVKDRHKIQQDQTDVDTSREYSFRLLTKEEELMPDIPSVAKPAVSPADVVHETIGKMSSAALDSSDVDIVPPLFSPACQMASDPYQCSNDSLRSFTQNYLKDKLTQEKQWFTVLVLIDRKGKAFFDDVKGLPCIDCEREKIVKDMVKDMPKWQPAELEGKTTKVVATIPIFY